MTRSASVSPQEHARVSELLGREARGLRAIPVKDAAGQPVVIRVASLVDDRPFPTLFWLVDPGLSYRIDQLEAGGFIAELQARVDAELDLREAMAEDHTAHIALRNSLMSEEDRARLQSLGFFESLQQRGIGGIEKTDRIRCLHTWYAAHLVAANTIGGLVDAHWSAGDGAG